MRRCGYPWVDNAWIVWCHFPSSGDFVDSLVGVRALVPDHTTERAIGEDSVGKPLTYMVQSRQRQPPAPSLLGDASAKEIMEAGALAITKMTEDLLTACDEGSLEKVKSVLDSKCQINSQDDAGLTALSVAAGLGLTDICKELISRKADMNATDFEGDSVLTVAVGEGRRDVVKLLLESGADVDVKVSGAWVDKPKTTVTLFQVAEHKGFKKIAALLNPDKLPRPSVETKTATPPAASATSPAASAKADAEDANDEVKLEAKRKPARPKTLQDELAGVGDQDEDAEV